MPDRFQNVLRRQNGLIESRPLIFLDITIEFIVELQASNRRKVVALGIEK